MFRRPLRRMIVRPIVQNALTAQLNQAEALRSAGSFVQAAELYSKLAVEAAQSGHPRVAGNLHARAAQTWLDAGNEPQAVGHEEKALSIFKQMQMNERAQQFQANFTRHQQMLKSGNAPVTPSIPTKHRPLPTTCPQCGAPIRSDEVEWIDESSAECDFCGAVIAAL